MAQAESDVVGREAELGTLAGFLDQASALPGAFLLEGEAGIGKTTLWRRGLELASERSYRVLSCRPSGSETQLSFAGLGDLLEDVLEDVLTPLPEPQRRALAVALLLEHSDGPPPDQLAIARAFLGALRALAHEGQVAIAVDDVQWLDRSSAFVLEFALRRLREERVAALFGLRSSEGQAALGLERALPDGQLQRLVVGPLSPGAVRHLLSERLGLVLSRPRLRRLHELSGGNPFFALELGRAFGRGVIELEAGEPLPGTLATLVEARLAGLPATTRTVLLAASALSQPTLEVVARAAGDEQEHSLEAALEAHVIELDGDRIRFSHPLLSAAVYATASAAEKRALHRRLAGLVGNPEERARHLALATDGPDAEVAGALEEAARHSRARGAPDAAAELAELARRLTPSDEASALRRRGLEAAEYHFDAGDATRATDLLREVIASSPPGPARADLLHRLSSMSWMNLIHGVRGPALEALEEAGEDPELRGAIHDTLAWVAFYLGDLDGASEHARMCALYAADVADPGGRANALATLGFVEFLQGRPSEDLMVEAIELQDVVMATRSWTEAGVYTSPRSVLGLELMWSGRLDEARRVLEQELAECETHAMYTVRGEVLEYLSETESRAGRWRLAARYGAEATAIEVESGRAATGGHVALFPESLAAACLGQVEDARRLATEGIQGALSNDDLFYANSIRAVLGFLELSLSNYEQARAHLDPVVAYLERMGSAEPGIIPCLPDYVEALVSLGSADEAEPLVDRLEEQGYARDRPWAVAVASRCRGLIAAARGDLEGSQVALERAVVEHRRVPQPFDRARTLLALGAVQRRARRRRAAREALEEALAIFDDLGATIWAEHARVELARIGGRRAGGAELSATEERVAELVARGLTNKAVARELVVTDRTVEGHLTRIYAKLGVRTRSELARRFADRRS